MNFWKNKTVLITGGMGFVGTWLAEDLLKKGSKLILFDRDFSRIPNSTHQQKYPCILIKGDISDYSLVKKTIAENEIDIIFHLAGSSILEECSRDPLGCFESNIKGTWNILEACRNKDTIKSIVVTSSYKVYGDQADLPFREDLPLAGVHPYDVAKVCADILARSFFPNFNMPVAVIRCANTYGGGDLNLSRIIPDTICSLLKDEEIVIRSDGTPERDYIYIKDVVSGFLATAENLHNNVVKGQAFNFGSGSYVSVIDLVTQISTILNKKGQFRILKPNEHKLNRQFLDITKAGSLLNWRPIYNLDQGLRESIDWYKKHWKI